MCFSLSELFSKKLTNSFPVPSKGNGGNAAEGQFDTWSNISAAVSGGATSIDLTTKPNKISIVKRKCEQLDQSPA